MVLIGTFQKKTTGLILGHNNQQASNVPYYYIILYTTTETRGPGALMLC